MYGSYEYKQSLWVGFDIGYVFDWKGTIHKRTGQVYKGIKKNTAHSTERDCASTSSSHCHN